MQSPLLWVLFCIRDATELRKGRLFLCLRTNLRLAASMKPPCLAYLSTSNRTVHNAFTTIQGVPTSRSTKQHTIFTATRSYNTTGPRTRNGQKGTRYPLLEDATVEVHRYIHESPRLGSSLSPLKLILEKVLSVFQEGMMQVDHRTESDV